MPKQLKEINKFNLGTVMTSSERDILEDANAFSLNVDSISKDGVLAGIPNDLFKINTAQASSEVLRGSNWNKLGWNNLAQSHDGTVVADITKFDTSFGNTYTYTGVLGYRDSFGVQKTIPHMEPLLVASGTPDTQATYTPSNNYSSSATSIDLSENSGSGTTANLVNFLQIDDYIQFQTSGDVTTKNGTYSSTFEVMKITKIEGDVITVERNFLNTPTQIHTGTTDRTLNATTAYYLVANRLTIPEHVAPEFDTQITTNRGTLLGIMYKDSTTKNKEQLYSGNHWGYDNIEKAHPLTLNLQLASKTAVAADNTITFGSSTGANYGTITFQNYYDFSKHFSEGDTLQIYGDSTATTNSPNSVNVDGVISYINEADKQIGLTMNNGTLDTTEALTSGNYWFENNLIKNQTFHHGSTSGSTLCNQWKREYQKGLLLEDNNFTEDNSTNDTTIQATGGVHQGDNEYYPFESDDKYLKVISNIQNDGLADLSYDIDAVQTEIKITLASGATTLIFFTCIDDIIGVGSELMRVLKVNQDSVVVERGILGTTAATASAGAAIRKHWYPCATQVIPKDLIDNKATYRLTFYAKAITGSPVGGVAVELGGGYIDSSNSFKSFSSIKNSQERSIGFNAGNTFVDISLLSKPNGDISDDTVDSIWRKFQFDFTVPESVNIDNGIKIRLGNIGANDTAIGYDNVSLSKKVIVTQNNESLSFAKTTAFLDNKGVKDLVYYDSPNKVLKIINKFESDKDISILDSVESSPLGTLEAVSSQDDLTFVNKNKELHIGYGPNANDTSPMWLGYLNTKIFGEKVDGTLYVDSDTVPTYDTNSVDNMSKICVAGEYEYLEAEYDHASAKDLTITQAGHSREIGDNIIVREWQDTDNSWTGSGLWIVTKSETAYFECKRKTTLDAEPGNDAFRGGSNTGRVCYRPYYYYGIRAGESYIYRISPEDLIEATTDTVGNASTTYTKGKIERSSTMFSPIQSISVCYNKEDDGTGGGCINVLPQNFSEAWRVNVDTKWDNWLEYQPSKELVSSLEFRSFKWSNDNINGNIGGSTEVFGGLSTESTPIIEFSGLPSDIIETRGPKAITTSDGDYNPLATATTAITPVDFDSRIWVQMAPSSDTSYFSDGDRFLFCGIAPSTNTTGSDTIYMADRTPPTNVIIGKEIRYKTDGVKFRAGPYGRNDGINDGVHGDFTDDYIKNRSLFYWYLDDKNSMSKDKLERFRVVKNHSLEQGDKEYGSHADTAYIDFGQNVGWDSEGGELPQIKVAQYGLFQIADNDMDGVLDGTGVVVPTNTSWDIDNKRYGELHQKLSSHAVGLIGQCDNEWVRFGGRVQAQNPSYFVSGGNSNYGEDYPEKMKVGKCVFVATDMHFGDTPQTDEISFSGTTESSGIVTITCATAHNLQAGDNIFVRTESGGWDSSALNTYYVSNVQSSTVFQVWDRDVTHSGSSSGTFYPLSRRLNVRVSGHSASAYVYGSTDDGGEVAYRDENVRTFSHNTEDPYNGDIFKENGCFAPQWYTERHYAGGDPTKHDGDNTSTGGAWMRGRFPGYRFNVDRLNAQAGRMIRPFSMKGTTFEKLLINDGVSVDMPCFPDVIYHVNGSNNYLGRSENSYTTSLNEEIDNLTASKLFIASETEVNQLGSYENSRVYVCDWGALSPEKEISTDYDSSNTSGYSGRNTTSENGSNSDTAVEWIRGTVGGYTNSGNDATYHPIVELDVDGTAMTDSNSATYFPEGAALDGSWTSNIHKVENQALFRGENVLSGMYITIIDALTGMKQTRKIIASYSMGNTASDNVKVVVHFPFSHAPVANDTYIIWKHNLVATAPIKLFKTATEYGQTTYKDGSLADKAYNANPASGHSNDLTSVSSTTATTVNRHYLSVNDEINLSGTSSDTANNGGPYKVTAILGPKTFTISASDCTGGEWSVSDEDESMNTYMNPIYLPLSSPILKARFGGLDMRKLKSVAISSIADDSDDIAVTTSANHLFDVGDTVTMIVGDADQNGVYNIKADNDAAVFDVPNTDSTDNSGTAYTNQYELLLSSTKGASKIGELRFGKNSWDRGNIAGNVIKTTQDDDAYLGLVEASFSVEPASLADQSGDFFNKNTLYRYKVSLIYDGYQEGPISTGSWTFTDTSTRDKLRILINISNYSKRLSHVCVYRKDFEGDLYKLVREISTESGWSKNGDVYQYSFTDDGTLGATYESRSQLSELLTTTNLKYGMSAEIDGYLFAGNCSHEKIENASNMIFRSKPGMYSLFDWSTDFLQLKSAPTAMANFAGRLFIFDSNNIYKVNPHTLAIEDEFNGIGCSGKNSIVITEFGMFFADRNGCYSHDGSMPRKISLAIEKGGETDMLTLSNSSEDETREIHDVSWFNTGGNSENMIPMVTWDSSRTSVLFFVELKALKQHSSQSTTTVRPGLSIIKLCWAYNVAKTRWDLWEVDNNSEIGKPFLGTSGEIYLPIGSNIYEYLGGKSNRDFTWLSKKLTLGTATQNKVFTKVKIIGENKTLLSIGDQENNHSSDRLIVATNEGRINSTDMTYKEEGNDGSNYQLSGSNRKGKWIQFKLESMTKPIDSIGLIFRLKATK